LPLPRYVSRALSRGGYDQLGAFEPRLGLARDLWPSKEPRARQLLHDPPPDGSNKFAADRGHLMTECIGVAW
jgi:hypothetical protein